MKLGKNYAKLIIYEILEKLGSSFVLIIVMCNIDIDSRKCKKS